jgi:hypothetical protein
MVKAPDWYCLTKFKHSIFCIAKVSRKRKRRRKDSGNDSLIELLFILSPTYYTLHEAFFLEGSCTTLGEEHLLLLDDDGHFMVHHSSVFHGLQMQKQFTRQ